MSELSAQVRKALDAAVTAIGGSPRDGQIEMAEAVANALTDRHHLMVQEEQALENHLHTLFQRSYTVEKY